MAVLMYTPTTEDGALFILTTPFLPFKGSFGKDTFLVYSTDINIFKISYKFYHTAHIQLCICHI